MESKSVRLTNSGAGVGARVGASHGGAVVWAYVDGEHRRASVVLTMKITVRWMSNGSFEQLQVENGGGVSRRGSGLINWTCKKMTRR
ncbi:unnamed protein product [Camellia sinensis]